MLLPAAIAKEGVGDEFRAMPPAVFASHDYENCPLPPRLNSKDSNVSRSLARRVLAKCADVEERLLAFEAIFVEGAQMISFKEFLYRTVPEWFAKPVDEIVIDRGPDGGTQRLEEGKWLSVEFEDDMRIDRNTHMRTGEKHVHFHDRKGNELYAMTADGKPSHGSKPFKLTKTQASALEKEGIKIPPKRLVEAVLLGRTRILLLG
jgi:hypothetical protein